jgi:ketosteroid isomerase-like protein
MDKLALCESLFEAFARGDQVRIRQLCHPDIRVQQNNNPPVDLDTILGFSRAVNAVVSGFRYEEAKRSETTTGFVEEHYVRGTLPDGSALDLAVCVVADVEDGRIVDLREYLDMSAAAGLLAALG